MTQPNDDQFLAFFDEALALNHRLTRLRAFVSLIIAQPAGTEDGAEWERRATLCRRMLALTDAAAEEFLNETQEETDAV